MVSADAATPDISDKAMHNPANLIILPPVLPSMHWKISL